MPFYDDTGPFMNGCRMQYVYSDTEIPEECDVTNVNENAIDRFIYTGYSVGANGSKLLSRLKSIAHLSFIKICGRDPAKILAVYGFVRRLCSAQMLDARC